MASVLRRESSISRCMAETLEVRKGLKAGAGISGASAARLSRRRIEAVIDERERLVQEILRARAQNPGSQFAENAMQLLTRWWPTASWSKRDELLKSAGWLIRMEKQSDQSAGGRAS